MALPQIPECAAPPDLFDYDTWCAEDGYHARFKRTLPGSALRSGCHQLLHAATPLELTQEAVRNRVRVWRWETS